MGGGPVQETADGRDCWRRIERCRCGCDRGLESSGFPGAGFDRWVTLVSRLMDTVVSHSSKNSSE